MFNPTDRATTVRVGSRSGWLVDLRGGPIGPFDGSFELRRLRDRHLPFGAEHLTPAGSVRGPRQQSLPPLAEVVELVENLGQALPAPRRRRRSRVKAALNPAGAGPTAGHGPDPSPVGDAGP